MMRIFDLLFVNQLFHIAEDGATIFAPYGLGSSGYLVPRAREARVRSDVRRLVLVAMASTLAIIAIASSWGEAVPLAWFIGGALALIVIETAIILYVFSRLTAGLMPVPAEKS